MSDISPTLYVQTYENRDGIIAQNAFYHCVKTNLNSYKSSAQLKELLEREDLNSICEEELNKLKSLSSKVGFKETRAIYNNLRHVSDFVN